MILSIEENSIILCRCDIGPKLAFEAVGTIDSRLRTVTFLADKPSKEDTATSADQKAKSTKKSKAPSKAPLQELALAGGTKSAVEESPFNEPGVVFYLDEKNIVKGILLWNLANDYFDDPEYISPQRLNVARKVRCTSIFIYFFIGGRGSEGAGIGGLENIFLLLN